MQVRKINNTLCYIKIETVAPITRTITSLKRLTGNKQRVFLCVFCVIHVMFYTPLPLGPLLQRFNSNASTR